MSEIEALMTEGLVMGLEHAVRLLKILPYPNAIAGIEEYLSEKKALITPVEQPPSETL